MELKNDDEIDSSVKNNIDFKPRPYQVKNINHLLNLQLL